MCVKEINLLQQNPTRTIIAAIQHGQGDLTSEARAHQEIATSFQRLGNFQDAHRELQESVRLNEEARNKAGSAAWKSGYIAKYNVAASMVGLLQVAHPSAPEMGYDREAFATADSAFGSYVFDTRISAPMAGIEEIRERSKEATIVLLPSHKSYVDFLVLSYVFRYENLSLPLMSG